MICLFLIIYTYNIFLIFNSFFKKKIDISFRSKYLLCYRKEFFHQFVNINCFFYSKLFLCNREILSEKFFMIETGVQNDIMYWIIQHIWKNTKFRIVDARIKYITAKIFRSFIVALIYFHITIVQFNNCALEHDSFANL